MELSDSKDTGTLEFCDSTGEVVHRYVLVLVQNHEAPFEFGVRATRTHLNGQHTEQTEIDCAWSSARSTSAADAWNEAVEELRNLHLQEKLRVFPDDPERVIREMFNKARG